VTKPDASAPRRVASTTRPKAIDDTSAGIATPRRILALAWLVLFCLWFYSFGLPNNPFVLTTGNPTLRWMVWKVLPFDLLDLVDPPVVPNAAPWSWLFLGQRLPFLMTAGFLWAGALSLGRLELRALRTCPQFDRAERFFFAGCLGLATVSLMMLGLGLLGGMSRWPLLMLLMSAGLAELWLTWRDMSAPACHAAEGVRGLMPPGSSVTSSGDSPFTSPGGSSGSPGRSCDAPPVWLPWIVCGVAVPFVLCMLLGAMSPQTDFDVIEYHLGGPKEWFQQGRITRLPHNVYTSFPFLTEMLLLAGMALYGDWQWGALAGQAAIAGFAPLTAVGLYATGRRWFSASAGWLAVLVWLTTPWVYRISIIAYAEGGLACYLFAAFAIALRIVWTRNEHPVSETTEPAAGSPVPNALYFLCGLLAGSAMACKYTGLISVVVPVGVLLAWSAAWPVARSVGTTGRVRHLILPGSLFAAGVAAAVGPWLLKNAVETGNPVFPLAYSVFGGEGRDAAMDEQWRRGHSSHYVSPMARLRDLPVKLTDVVANNDWHSALMFGLAPIALLAAWRRKVWCVWAFIGWQFLSWFLFTHHIDRFYVPMFPVVALLAGCGAGWLMTFGSGRWCSAAVIVACVLFNVWIMAAIGGFNAGRTDLNVAADLVVPPSKRWLNGEYASGRLPPDFKALCVGEAALFHAKFPCLYNTVFDRSRFEQWFAERTESGGFRLRPTEQIRETLRQQGVTHVLVNWSEILRYREQGSYGYTDFAHPDWLAKLQSAGVLDPPLPLPDWASFVPVNEAKRRQVAEWAPELGASLADRPGLRAVQIFPVRR
jgi:hypothetical protein